MAGLTGSGAFCHWLVNSPWIAYTGKRLPTPSLAFYASRAPQGIKRGFCEHVSAINVGRHASTLKVATNSVGKFIVAQAESLTYASFGLRSEKWTRWCQQG